jgi:UDP-N-acetylglucosamine acyltransferase
LRRRGFSAATIDHIRHAYKTLYREGLLLEDAKRALAAQCAECPEIRPLLDFLEQSQRGIVR